MNYLPNLQLGIDAVNKAGGISEGTLCYSGNVLNPRGNKYTVDYYLQLARDLVATGAHVLCVKVLLRSFFLSLFYFFLGYGRIINT